MVGGARPPAVDALRRTPARTAVLTDFDGTLAPIVDDPASSRPVPGAVEALTALAGSYACVGVLSGRPVDFLRGLFPPEVALAGLYGLETVVAGERRDHPLSGRWRAVVDGVVAEAEAGGPEGMRVEAKGLSLTLHYRGRPERAADVEAWAEHQADRSGLELRPAKMSYELHPPLDVDKGTAVVELLGERVPDLGAVCFIGDDVGDLPAFDALDRLAGSGVATLKVGVQGPEGEPRLLDRADLVVEGPAGVLALLQALVLA